MAITRSQIARQLLQFGGGADLGTASSQDFGFGDRGGRDDREIGARASRTRAAAEANQRALAALGDPDYQVDKDLKDREGIGATTLENLKSKRGLFALGLLNPVFGLTSLLPAMIAANRVRSQFGLPSTPPLSETDGSGDEGTVMKPFVAPLAAQTPRTKEQEPEPEVEEPFQLARRFRAEGGRIGAQEGGIMPRLNQLGSGVSSAEQTLQDINQRLESAESSLGGGGGELGIFAPSRPENTMGPMAQIPASGGVKLPELQDQLMKIDPPIFMRPGNIPGTDAPFSSLRSGIPAASYADGGNVVGGEFDFESARQMYGLGKLVKKVTKTVKKIAKSDIGKAALIGAIGFGIPGTSLGGIFGRASFGGYAPGVFGFGGIGNAIAAGKAKFFANKTLPGLITGPKELGMTTRSLGLGPGTLIAGASALAGLLTPEQEQEAQELARGEGIDIEEARNSILARARAETRDDYKMDFRARRFRAEGGSMKEPVAKKTMPLLDLDGKEMDLREEGGFVPIGRMEKADDVPARLSKNEFVFTADAVRNAGDGNVDKGAEVMYNMMKNLEAGGDVSEESQGLEGARKMFQTSQRLEEVL